MVGLLLLPVLCCALPLLIAAGAVGAVGSMLGNPWVIGAAALLLLVAMVWSARRRGGATRDDSCRSPVPPDRHRSDRTSQSSTLNQEP